MGLERASEPEIVHEVAMEQRGRYEIVHGGLFPNRGI